MENVLVNRVKKSFIVVSLLYCSIVAIVCNGNSWRSAPSLAGDDISLFLGLASPQVTNPMYTPYINPNTGNPSMHQSESSGGNGTSPYYGVNYFHTFSSVGHPWLSSFSLGLDASDYSMSGTAQNPDSGNMLDISPEIRLNLYSTDRFSLYATAGPGFFVPTSTYLVPGVNFINGTYTPTSFLQRKVGTPGVVLGLDASVGVAYKVTRDYSLLGEWRWQDAPSLAPGGYGLQASIFDAGIRVNY